MADSSTEAYQVNPEILSEAAIPFRFEVTWRSLTEPSQPAPSEPALPEAARQVSRRAPGPAPEAREWEMILPRMKRPAPVQIPASLTAEHPAESAPALMLHSCKESTSTRGTSGTFRSAVSFNLHCQQRI